MKPHEPYRTVQPLYGLYLPTILSYSLIRWGNYVSPACMQTQLVCKHKLRGSWFLQAQLPPTQTRGRGVEAVFGSALDPTSPASEASTLPPGSGETHPEPRLNSHAEASSSAMFSGGTRRGDGQSSAGPRDAWQSGQQGSYRDFAQLEAPIHRRYIALYSLIVHF